MANEATQRARAILEEMRATLAATGVPPAPTEASFVNPVAREEFYQAPMAPVASPFAAMARELPAAVPPAPPRVAPAPAPVGMPVMPPAPAVEPPPAAGPTAGAAGTAMPSRAQDERDRATRISKMLEQGLSGGAGPVERVGEAALKTYMSGGRISFPEAMRQIEQQEFTRAYNTATAMSGLARRFGLAETVASGRQDAANQRLVMTETMKTLRDISDDYGPEAAVAAQRFLQENDPDPTGSDPVAARRVLSQVYNEIGRQYPRIGRRAAAAGPTAAGPAAQPAGLTKDENGLWVPPAGRRLTNQQEMSNRLRREGDVAGADEIDAQMIRTAQGAPRQRQGQGKSPTDKYSDAMLESQTAIGLIDRTRGLLASGAPVGAAGFLSQTLDGFRGQLEQLGGVIKFGQPGEAGGETSLRQLQNPAGTNLLWNKFTSEAGLKEQFSWISRESAADAQKIKSNILLLAFAVARSIEPGGRLSNQDIQGVLTALGAGGPLTNANQMNAALGAIEDYVITRMQDKYDDLKRRGLFGESDPGMPFATRGTPPTPGARGAPAGVGSMSDDDLRRALGMQ